MKLLGISSFGDRPRNIGLKSSILAIAILALPMYTAQATPPELERLKYFEGNWICQQPAGSTEPSGEFTWNAQLGLNGFWYLVSARQTQASAGGQSIDSQEFLGYDSAAGKLIRSVVVSNGNFYNVTADDWEGDRLVWEGIINIQGNSTALRQKIVKDSPNRFTTTYFMFSKEDSWLPIVEEACDRQT